MIQQQQQQQLQQQSSVGGLNFEETSVTLIDTSEYVEDITPNEIGEGDVGNNSSGGGGSGGSSNGGESQVGVGVEVGSQSASLKSACNWCREKKKKCDGKVSCSNCVKRGLVCVFSDQKKRGRKMKFLENQEQIDRVIVKEQFQNQVQNQLNENKVNKDQYDLNDKIGVQLNLNQNQKFYEDEGLFLSFFLSFFLSSFFFFLFSFFFFLFFSFFFFLFFFFLFSFFFFVLKKYNL
jgi:hypothetical protein